MLHLRIPLLPGTPTFSVYSMKLVLLRLVVSFLNIVPLVKWSVKVKYAVACHVIPASGRLVDVDFLERSDSTWPDMLLAFAAPAWDWGSSW